LRAPKNLKEVMNSFRNTFRGPGIKSPGLASLIRALCAVAFASTLVLLSTVSCHAETREEVRKLYSTGVEYIKQMKYEDAEVVFRKIVEAGYEFPEAYGNLGYAKMRLRKNSEAIFEFKNALNLNPDYTDALNNLGIIYMEHPATIAMGLSHLKKVVELKPDNPDYHDSLGMCYHKMGFMKEAEKEFMTSILLDKTGTAPVLHLGMLFESDGKDEQAAEKYRWVIAMNRNHLIANYRLFKMSIRRDERHLMALYLSNLLKILKEKNIDRFERESVEQEILCNFKAFIVEVAMNFNVEMRKIVISESTSETSVAASEYLISYEEFAKKKLFSFFEGTELRCPETGKYYTNYVNHVICPVHGHLPIFTDKLDRIKEMRSAYHRNICQENRKMLEYAMFISNMESTDEIGLSAGSIKNLIGEGSLRDIPECPDAGSYSLDAKGFVSCSIHGGW